MFASHLSPRQAALTDAIALLVFVTVGLLSHHGGVSATGYARDALPILGGWFGAAAVFGLYRERTVATLLKTWIAGVPAGILVRAVILDRYTSDELKFLAVALVFTLAFVLAARTAAGSLLRLRG